MQVKVQLIRHLGERTVWVVMKIKLPNSSIAATECPLGKLYPQSWLNENVGGDAESKV